MDMTDRLWLEAHARAQSGVDADTREEAYEVFLAEAARCRLADRVGAAAWQLRSGVMIRGRQAHAAVEGHLALTTEDGSDLLVSVAAVVIVTGGSPALRREGTVGQTLSSCLREAWGEGRTIRVLLTDGAWRTGELDFVGADHVTLRAEDALVTVPLVAAEAWQLG